MTAAGAAVALSASPGTILTVGTTVLVALLAAGSAAGGFAAFKTGRTNAIAASAVARATEAEATANTWKARVDAVQAEFDAYRGETQRAIQHDREAAAAAAHEVTKLKEQVATLEGVVTARHEITELLTIVTALGQTVTGVLSQLETDHDRQHRDHEQILARLREVPS